MGVRMAAGWMTLQRMGSDCSAQWRATVLVWLRTAALLAA